MPTVVIPWAGNCSHRRRALDFVQSRYAEVGWPVILAPGGSPWVKADAVMPAVRSLSGVVVIADADCWVDNLPEAVRAVELGAPWAKPHTLVHRLTETSTRKYLAGADWRGLPTQERPYRGVVGGGFTVATADTFREVPMDPRYEGWGQEDVSLGLALHTLKGRAWLGGADLIHLYHPPQPRLTRRYGSLENKRLLQRYIAAKRDPHVMRRLVEEIHARRPDEQNMLGGPALQHGD